MSDPGDPTPRPPSAGETFREAEGRLFERYGVEAASSWYTLPDPPLRVRCVEAGAGTPVVLVHGGAGGFAGLWAPLMRGLPANRVIAMDRPGHGLSEAFRYGDPELRRHAVAFMTSFLDALGLEAAVVGGNSMGGLWCFWLALDRPERVRAVVQFGCPAFILDTSPRLHLLIKVRRMLMRRPPSPELARRILQRVAGRPAVDAAPPELLEAVAAVEAMSDHRIAALSLLELALRLRRQVPKLRLGEQELAALTQPVLFVWGEHDAFGDPAWGRRACELLANARMEEVAGGGHLPWLDDPELSAEAVTAFLGAEVGT